MYVKFKKHYPNLKWVYFSKYIKKKFCRADKSTQVWFLFHTISKTPWKLVLIIFSRKIWQLYLKTTSIFCFLFKGCLDTKQYFKRKFSRCQYFWNIELLADYTSFLGNRNYKNNFYFCPWPLSSCFATGLKRITDNCEFWPLESEAVNKNFLLMFKWFALATLNDWLAVSTMGLRSFSNVVHIESHMRT